MDTHFALVLIVLILSVGMVMLLTVVEYYQHKILSLKESIKIYRKGKSYQRLAENLTTVSENIKDREHTLQVSSEKAKLLDKNLDSRTKILEL